MEAAIIALLIAISVVLSINSRHITSLLSVFRRKKVDYRPGRYYLENGDQTIDASNSSILYCNSKGEIQREPIAILSKLEYVECNGDMLFVREEETEEEEITEPDNVFHIIKRK
jgi:hypothetical protein